MNLVALLTAVTPGLVARGAWHHVRTAAREASAARLKGAAWLAHAWKRFRPKPPPAPALEPLGPVATVTRTSPGSVELSLGARTLRVTAHADDFLELHAGGAHTYAFSTSGFAGAALALTETADAVTLATPALTLTITRSRGALTLATRDGSALFDDLELLGAQGGCGLRARFPAGCAFHGLGEKACAYELSGRRYALWNTDPALYQRGDDPLYLSIPFLLAQGARHATGLFFDNPQRAEVDLSAAPRLEWLAHGGPLRLFVSAGTPARVLERYTALTGRPRLPPLWALGFHQSRYSYYPQARVLELAREFRERKIPCDVIHLDIHYMDGYRCFTWHPERFPEPRAMLDELHAQGFKALSMIDPGIKVDPGYRVYAEGLERRAFITWPGGEPFVAPVWPGDCHFPDFSSPAVRAWWGEQYRGLLDDGVDAFWNDMNELALISVPVGAQVPDVVRHHAEGHGASHAELHNEYGGLMARASVEGLASLRPTKRPVLLTRSGWAGVQRHAMHWTGDNDSTWDHLRLSLQMVLNLGVSGIALTGPDTGGFAGNPEPELFARWMQLSAFLPFFRVHSIFGSRDQEPWAFGPEVERVAREAIERRYRLLPYLYTAAWQSAQAGTPIARAMSFSFPDDPRFRGVDDQFMFGDALLVAPVLEARATARSVLLPQGTWFELASGKRHEGGARVDVSAALEEVPVFARGGSVIPSWELQQYVGEKRLEVLELLACVVDDGAAHESVLYEDDGEAVVGPHRVSRFVLRGERLTRTIVDGTYQPTARRVRLRRPGAEGAFELDAPGDFEHALR